MVPFRTQAYNYFDYDFPILNYSVFLILVAYLALQLQWNSDYDFEHYPTTLVQINQRNWISNLFQFDWICWDLRMVILVLNSIKLGCLWYK